MVFGTRIKLKNDKRSRHICEKQRILVLVALVGGGKGPGCGFKFAGSSSRVLVRVRRSKSYGNLGVKLYDYGVFSRPPKYIYLVSCPVRCL